MGADSAFVSFCWRGSHCNNWKEFLKVFFDLRGECFQRFLPHFGGEAVDRGEIGGVINGLAGVRIEQ